MGYKLREKGNLVSEQSGEAELDRFLEMSNLRKSETGLPVNIWLDDSGRWRKTPHGNRIKFQGDAGNRVNIDNAGCMSIEDVPQIFEQPKDLRLNSKQIKAIQQFIRNNKELIEQLGRTEISILEFGRRMVPNK